MAGLVQIRNVPDETRQGLKARAAARGESLNDYLLKLLIRTPHVRLCGRFSRSQGTVLALRGLVGGPHQGRPRQQIVIVTDCSVVADALVSIRTDSIGEHLDDERPSHSRAHRLRSGVGREGAGAWWSHLGASCADLLLGFDRLPITRWDFAHDLRVPPSSSGTRSRRTTLPTWCLRNPSAAHWSPATADWRRPLTHGSKSWCSDAQELAMTFHSSSRWAISVDRRSRSLESRTARSAGSALT